MKRFRGEKSFVLRGEARVNVVLVLVEMYTYTLPLFSSPEKTDIMYSINHKDIHDQGSGNK